MHRVIFRSFSLVLSIVAFACSSLWAKDPPRKVIFLIGDGMGLTQISGSMAFCEGRNAFERFKVIGLSKTSSADNYVTESAAGATAFAIGEKTYNSAIGVDKDTVPLPSLFELAHRNGFSTGVAVTSSVVHATPASFFAHVPNRRRYEEIAGQFLNGHCDVAIGGGTKFFTSRKDGRNLLKELQARGYTTVVDTVCRENVSAQKLLYLLADDGCMKMEAGRGDLLNHAASLAMRNLEQNKKGYFLMIEGSQIDWGGHDSNFTYMCAELNDFNHVINNVLDAAEKDGNTLVVVTADHETGGLSLKVDSQDPKKFVPHYAYNKHTGVMVPVFAYGPGAEEFMGIYENNEIFHKFLKVLGWKK
jgi:alkaline phosphatase